MSQADNTQSLAPKLEERGIPIGEIGVSAPDSCAALPGIMLHAVRGRKYVGKNHLHDRRGAVRRDIRNHDAALRRRRGVNDVVPRGEDADVAEPRQCLHQRTGDGYFVGQDDVRILRPLEDLAGGGAVVNCAFAQGFERLPREVAGVEGVGI